MKLETSTPQGSSLWSQNLPENRPISCLKCPQTKDQIVATGDKSGRVRIWRNASKFLEGHWHSLPIQALEFSLDAVHLFSGGGEGVILKWDVKNMQKLALVPRLGSTLTHISTSFGKVLTCTQNNVLKIFTSNFEDEGSISGLTTQETSLNKLKWDSESASLVLVGSTGHHLQYFDPLSKKQKSSVELISQNVVLGEREQDTKVQKNILVDFDLNSLWIVSLERTWDMTYSLKFFNNGEKKKLANR